MERTKPRVEPPKRLAWLKAQDKFASTQDGNNEKGHTHDKLDHTFSVIMNILIRMVELETPEDFKRAIEENYKPTGGKSLIVVICPGTWACVQGPKP